MLAGCSNLASRVSAVCRIYTLSRAAPCRTISRKQDLSHFLKAIYGISIWLAAGIKRRLARRML
jgi:hypothetical protein